MTRAAVFGPTFDAAVELLGLERVEERPDLVLVDLADADAVAAAAEIAAAVPRIVIARPEHERLLRAAGASVLIAPSAHAAAIGPLISAATPSPGRAATRLVVVTGTRGGIGRTLLVTGLAERLAARTSVLVIDATGSGAAGWWLRLAPGPWSDLEGLVDELTAEHLAVVAAERDRLRVIGGTSAMPTAALLSAAARAAIGIADLVLVDASPLFDDRTRSLLEQADRVLLVATADAASVAAIDGWIDDDRSWLIASRTRADRVGPHGVFRWLPDDPAAVRSAERGQSIVGGALGRAYDDLAELLALDIS